MFNLKLQFLVLYLVLGCFALTLYNASPLWQTKAEVLRDGVILAWMASLMDICLLGNGLSRLFGIRPRRLFGLLGIVFSPLLHRDLGHLIANTVPFLVLGWLVLLQNGLQDGPQSELQGDGGFYAVTMIILLVGGLGTWLLGRDATHLGASGLIFGYVGFLLMSGVAGTTVMTLGLGVIVLLLYGPQLSSMIPSSSDKTVSWEGHFFGFVGGLVAGAEPDLLNTLSTAFNQLL